MDTTFQLDGRVAYTPNMPGDDWATLYMGPGASSARTGILADPGGGGTIFSGGGSKDINDIPSWRHTSGTVPDKNDITNAYAASYTVEHDDEDHLLIYFGADRYTTNGDANLGFWFFKGDVEPLPNGTFSGSHQNGDVLILVNYQQGGTIPQVQALEWHNGGLRSLVSDGSAKCGADSDLSVCAITNDTSIDSPWAYQPKGGAANIFPAGAFFEGGINITKLFGGNSSETCFKSFLAESRSSTSTTASLKDFVYGTFPVCGVGVSLQCVSSELSANGNSLIYSYEGTVSNNGQGTLHDVEVTDDKGSTIKLGTLEAGKKLAFEGQFASLDNPAAVAAKVKAATSPGSNNVLEAQSGVAECPADRDPAISVTRSCETQLELINGAVGLVVNVSGQVCNTSAGPKAVGLSDVKVVDRDDLEYPIGALSPGQCKYYEGSYIPGELPNNIVEPSQAKFNGTAKATGIADFGFGPVEEQASASCGLCPG